MGRFSNFKPPPSTGRTEHVSFRLLNGLGGATPSYVGVDLFFKRMVEVMDRDAQFSATIPFNHDGPISQVVVLQNVRQWDPCSYYMDKMIYTSLGICPPGWATFNGRCYEFNQQNKRDWAGAKQYCDAQNTTMMIVDSSDESRFLTMSGFLSRRGISAVWLGFNRKYSPS